MAMETPRTTIFLPCHTLDDFPTWIDGNETADVVAAWTAGWDPWLMAATGACPSWASLDLAHGGPPPPIGIVPAAFDDRYVVDDGRNPDVGQILIRGISRREDIIAEIAGRQGLDFASLPGRPLAPDFHALGLAVLLSELLARRMRSATNLEATDFESLVLEAARSAAAGNETVAREGLAKAYGTLEAVRGHYYPVDLWVIDLVLLSETTLGGRLADELAAPTPLAVLANGRTIDLLAARSRELLEPFANRLEQATLEAVGGLYDDVLLDLSTPESIVDELRRGGDAWQRHLHCVPTTFGSRAGCQSSLLAQILPDLGYQGCLWNAFDGERVPDAGSSRIVWQGEGERRTEGIAAPVIDARSATAILEIPERFGDAMDHEHTAIVLFVHHAGTAAGWFADLRRIASWTTALGRFVTPTELLRATPAAGTPISPLGDAFTPRETTPSVALVDRIRTDAVAVLSAQACLQLAPSCPKNCSGSPPAAAVVGPTPATAQVSGWWPRLARRHRDREDRLRLSGKHLSVRLHPKTGGIIAVRPATGATNRLSQRLAVRTDESVGHRPPEDMFGYSTMEADAIERLPGRGDSDGDRLVSRGRLCDAQSRVLAQFTQTVFLVPGLPLVNLDIQIEPGPIVLQADRVCHPWISKLICRFAWNENDDVDIIASRHTQAVRSERIRFLAPQFFCIESAGVGPNPLGQRKAEAAQPRSVTTVLTGGQAWHIRSSPHTIDTLLCSSTSGSISCRLGIGIDLPDVAWLGIASAAGAYTPWESTSRIVIPSGIRLTDPVVAATAADAPLLAQVGILELEGRGRPLTIDWGRRVISARTVDLRGADRQATSMTIAGTTTELTVGRHEWLHLCLEFER
jgi:hypothetical protein